MPDDPRIEAAAKAMSQHRHGPGYHTDGYCVDCYHGAEKALAAADAVDPVRQEVVRLREALRAMVEHSGTEGFGGYSPWECVFCQCSWRTDPHEPDCEWLFAKTILSESAQLL